MFKLLFIGVLSFAILACGEKKSAESVNPVLENNEPIIKNLEISSTEISYDVSKYDQNFSALCGYSYNDQNYNACTDVIWMGYCIANFVKQGKLDIGTWGGLTDEKITQQANNYIKVGLYDVEDVKAIAYVKNDRRICGSHERTPQSVSEFWARYKLSIEKIKALNPN